MKPKIAILTTLADASPAYSLVSIILQQARILKKHGYETDLLVLRNFRSDHKKELEDDPTIDVKFVLPQTILVDYKPTQKPEEDDDKKKGFESQAKIHLEGNGREDGFMKILEPYDVVIDHDIMFLSWFLPQNKALREVMKAFPEKNYLHWVHSRPSSPPEGTCYPSTLRYDSSPGTYVYLNETDRQHVSVIYRMPVKNVAVVYNAKDIRDVCCFTEDARAFIDEYDLMDHQIFQVYPFSTPRWRDKGVRQLIKVWGCWKNQNIRARLVLVTAHSNNEVDKKHIKAIEEYVKKCDLRIDDDVVITHRFANLMAEREKDKKKDWLEWRYCVPSNVIRDLMLLSNIFVFPTDSEVCSLVQAEAAVLGNLLVLNKDFPALYDFAPQRVLGYNFKINDPDNCNSEYYPAVAREIWANLQEDLRFVATTEARTKIYNAEWIFKNQLEPLLWRGFSHKLSKNAKPKIIATNTPKTIPKSDYCNPQPGMYCEIYGECSPMQKDKCYGHAGHCPMLDEVIENVT